MTDPLDPAHVPTYIQEAVHRLRQKFDAGADVLKSVLVRDLHDIVELVRHLPDDVGMSTMRSVIADAKNKADADLADAREVALRAVHVAEQFKAEAVGLRAHLAALLPELEAARGALLGRGLSTAPQTPLVIEVPPEAATNTTV